ncbi:5-amino-6-(5-phosphoribosylamino)uracil reductase [Methanospirillum hungatei JF-1]|jgi:2,5-diamino-6-(ribosylamino)-4(3H)-pyrimidinone 5'-phosphate reductase|uniref:5-amino-6-(5-phosphoribosylamino)uracil reductase n=1 Tax=Methanospirillum hungatei JF-1 (strain ATCC 27890 / DSM 864 / NBRC 100397 / JF-1) TaxID=323259 RepID=Q2FLI7_METHJ|nr:dihydrofolate reductase family protein [Methanospirillum hungatei]ABD40559.1 5-amino-6-(5-phosphoribosylamino)uracil reductase [Methanospirillum hungatei JF-1]
MSDHINRPYVTLVSEVTIDGKLTVTRGASSKLLMQFMSHEAEVLLHQIRADSDAIMVGANTIRIDNSFLTVRHVEGKNPIRVIPSSKADISPDANVLSPDAPTIIAVSARADKETCTILAEKGAYIEICGDEFVDLPILMRLLFEKYSVQSLMIEGGSTLNGNMFQKGLIDELLLIHLPFIAGGEDTPSLVTGLHPRDVSDLLKLDLITHFMAGENLITKWRVVRS